jgi:hypothetical protein
MCMLNKMCNYFEMYIFLHTLIVWKMYSIKIALVSYCSQSDNPVITCCTMNTTTLFRFESHTYPPPMVIILVSAAIKSSAE